MRRFIIPAATAAAVLAVVAGTAVVRNGADSNRAAPSAARRLPPLVIPGRDGEGSVGKAALGAPDAPVGPGGRYLLRGTLPETPADDAPAYRLPWRAATREHAVTVARALGLSGEPTQTEGGWTVMADGRTLYVSDGPGVPWSVYAGHAGCAAADPALKSDPSGAEPALACDSPAGVASAPAVAVAPCHDGREPAGDTPGKDAQVQRMPCDQLPKPKRPPQPSKDDALSVANEVLARLGAHSDRELSVTDGWIGVTVVATPRHDGLAVHGWQTYLTVDATRRVVGGNGWLGEPVKADRYPVIGARAAFDSLPRMPRILMCEQVKGEDGCAPPPDVIVTGATLGLVHAPSPEPRGDSYLLPAWIFTVAGDGQDIAVVAVPERYWAEPAPNTKPLEPPDGVPAPEPGSGGCAVDDRPVSSDGSTGAAPTCDPGATGGGAPGSSGGSAPAG